MLLRGIHDSKIFVLINFLFTVIVFPELFVKVPEFVKVESTTIVLLLVNTPVEFIIKESLFCIVPVAKFEITPLLV